MSTISRHYNKFIKLFDVSLRDGLQSWKKIPSTDEKKQILHKIASLENVKNIEVGSIVSKKVLPQFQDSIELYHYTRKNYLHLNPYLLIPNKKMHEIALHNNIENMSFITSVSNEFQKKNTNMDLNKTKEELMYMINNTNGYKKLYISCVNECPISGVLTTDLIVNELLEYIKYPVNELCISDTCGTLTQKNLKKILDIILPIMQLKGESISKLSVHLHKNKDTNETKKIIHYCLDNYIYKFDVSYIEGGGCSVTMNNNKLNNNLTYYDFDILV